MKTIKASWILAVFVLLTGSQFTMAQKTNLPEMKPLTWEIGYASGINDVPAQWYPATVPGAVQLDLAKALKYGIYFYAENWKDYLWMEDQYFTYRTSFNKPAIGENQKCYFISKGIDYEFEILLNGEKILHQEGMFTHVKLDLNSSLKDKNEALIKGYLMNTL